jgi:hypothetical protein
MNQRGFLIPARILMALLLVIGIFAFFVQNNTTKVLAGDGYSFTAPSDIFLGENLKFIDSPFTDSSSGNLNITTPGTYRVTATDAKSTDKGYMVSGTNALHHKLQIGPASDNLTNSDEVVQLLEASTEGDNSIPFFVSQEISYEDTVAENYSITITFTVTAQ